DFVVIKITPLAARDPYKAAAGPPFRTEMLSMSSGLMLVRPSPISRPPYVPGVPWLALLIGIPFITYNGWLFPLSEPLPRMITRLGPEGPVDGLVAFTPAIFPESALPKLFSRALLKFSPPTSVT